ncbi:MAG: chorismate-binding protein, partial [Bacteroidales bacterium]
AGSICGAPKKSTCEIIKRAEGISRGYYTGIAGIFDGENLDSGVLIRFIEQDEKGEFHFRSGGGITAKSDAQSEYDELIQKIYVPVCRNNKDK